MILHQIKKTAGGAPYGFTLNGTSYFYILNLHGDVIGIYDSNGNVVVQYVYDSWGKLISITGSMADTVGVKNPLRYRGYYYDTLSGLYYLQSRIMTPKQADSSALIRSSSQAMIQSRAPTSSLIATTIR